MVEEARVAGGGTGEAPGVKGETRCHKINRGSPLAINPDG